MTRSAPIRPARELKSDAGDADRDPAELVSEIATELNLLSQSHRTPEAFLERRDFLVKRLRRLAARLRSSSAAPARGFLQRPQPRPWPGSAPLFAASAPKSSARETLTLKGRP